MTRRWSRVMFFCQGDGPLPHQYTVEFENHVARCHSNQDKEFKDQFAVCQHCFPVPMHMITVTITVNRGL